MRFGKIITAGLATALLLGSGAAQAGTDLNEVGAFLVYPAVAAFGDDYTTETFLALTHTGSSDVNAHIAFVNGEEKKYYNGSWHDNSEYCYECNYTIPLTPNDTELMVVRYSEVLGIVIDTEDDTLQGACPHPYGMVTVNLEDPIGTVITDNTLLGSQVVVNFDSGWAFSIPAIPFQGQNGGNGDRNFEFDGQEYGAFPRVIAADFIAPDGPWADDLSALLVLFTLNFETEFPPFSHCEIEGYDAAENPFSRSFNFGCWTVEDLYDLHPEFAFGNLGQQACNPWDNDNPCDTHGWFKLDCDVTRDEDSDTVVGGVHGAIIQLADQGAKVRRNHGDFGSEGIDNKAAWGRLLFQSVTTGGNVTYTTAGPGGGLGMN